MTDTNRVNAMAAAMTGNIYNKIAQGSAKTIPVPSEIQGEQRALTPEEEMLQFKKEFWDEVNRIPKTKTINTLIINVTDKAWERMKNEPDYRKQMMDLIKRDTMGSFIHQVDSVITIGASDKEYLAQSWSSDNDTALRKHDRDEAIERRRKKRKLQKAYNEMIRLKHVYWHQQFMQAGKQEALAEDAGSLVVSRPASASMLSFACASYESNLMFL